MTTDENRLKFNEHELKYLRNALVDNEENKLVFRLLDIVEHLQHENQVQAESISWLRACDEATHYAITRITEACHLDSREFWATIQKIEKTQPHQVDEYRRVLEGKVDVVARAIERLSMFDSTEEIALSGREIAKHLLEDDGPQLLRLIQSKIKAAIDEYQAIKEIQAAEKANGQNSTLNYLAELASLQVGDPIPDPDPPNYLKVQAGDALHDARSGVVIGQALRFGTMGDYYQNDACSDITHPTWDDKKCEKETVKAVETITKVLKETGYDKGTWFLVHEYFDGSWRVQVRNVTGRVIQEFQGKVSGQWTKHVCLWRDHAVVIKKLDRLETAFHKTIKIIKDFFKMLTI